MGMSSSKQKSSSSNQGYGLLRDAFSGVLPAATQGFQGVGALLSGDSTGFDAFKDATGFDNLLSRGLGTVLGSRAGSGVLNSGSTLKALQSYGQDLQNQTASSYLQNLLGMGQLGLGAGGVISSAGNTSKSSSKSKGLQGPSVSFGG